MMSKNRKKSPGPSTSRSARKPPKRAAAPPSDEGRPGLLESPDETGTEERLARAEDGSIAVGDETADEVRREFYEASRKGAPPRTFEESERLSKEDTGLEEIGGGGNTPDQDVVEEVGEAFGVTYEDQEPLHPQDKVEQRDEHRWELDPASSEDYEERQRDLAGGEEEEEESL